MRKLLGVTFLLALSLTSLLGQDSKPFHGFETRLREERAGFAGNKEQLSKVFNAERIRLGDRFEAELLTFLGSDVEKHYWISLFLKAPSYLHGNRPLPHLALLLNQQALSLLRGKTDRESLYYEAKLSVTAAVLSEELRLRILADVFKVNAERIRALDSESRTWFPAMDEYDRCLYDSIGKQRAVSCQRGNAANQATKRCTISGGFVDRMAISKPAPIYPEIAKAQGISGTVTVQILIDEEGKVEDATADTGPQELREAAVIAARQVRFAAGTRLSGKPVKVCAVLTYKFKG